MSNNSKSNIISDSETGISLADILEFIEESWKHLILAGVMGAVFAFGGWYFLGSYRTELILFNSPNTYGLDLVMWRTLQKNLPNLARQHLADKKLSSEQMNLYQQMSESIWWSKNVTPIFVISKSESKDFVSISKDLDSASSKILGLNILTNAISKEDSLENAKLASYFLRSGGAFIQIKSLLSNYESDVIITTAEIRNKMTALEIDQVYLLEHAKVLEDLFKRFPSSSVSNMSNVAGDINESLSKYLPITTQIIANKNDIRINKERLARFDDHLSQIKILNVFLEKALEISEQEHDGILLLKSLLTIEEKVRKNLSPNDIKNRKVLDQLRTELSSIEARFTKGLVASTPVTNKIGMLETTTVGIAIAELLILVLLLRRKIVR